jgi:hypothetical protein
VAVTFSSEFAIFGLKIEMHVQTQIKVLRGSFIERGHASKAALGKGAESRALAAERWGEMASVRLTA